MSDVEPEALHRTCWYGRRTEDLPRDLGFHMTIEDGKLLYCGHPMWFPVVGHHFDVRNCERCEYYKPVRSTPTAAMPPARVRR